MLIPPLNQLRTEDFPKEEQAWISKLLWPLNTFLTSATAAVNGNIIFGQNITGVERTLSISYSSATLPLTLSMPLPSLAKSLNVVQAFEDGTPVIIEAAWQAVDKNTVKISDLVRVGSASGATSLKTGSTYSLTFRATP